MLLFTPPPGSLSSSRTHRAPAASSLLTDRLQYRDAAKVRGAIRGRTISPHPESISAATLHQARSPAPLKPTAPFNFQDKYTTALHSLRMRRSLERELSPWWRWKVGSVGWLGRDRLPKMSSERAAVQHSSGLELKFLHWCFLRAMEHLKLSSMLGRIPSNPLESLPLLKGFIEKSLQRSNVHCSLWCHKGHLHHCWVNGNTFWLDSCFYPPRMRKVQQRIRIGSKLKTSVFCQRSYTEG